MQSFHDFNHIISSFCNFHWGIFIGSHMILKELSHGGLSCFGHVQNLL